MNFGTCASNARGKERKMADRDALAVLAELIRALDSEDDDRQLRALMAARETVDAHREAETDPRTLPGDIAGPGGPFDEGAVVFDGRNAVLLETIDVGRLDGRSELSFGVVLGGRINKSQDRAQVLYYAPLDGLASIITQLHGVAERSGALAELHALCSQRWDEMPHVEND